jgi:hypothetical protein
MYTLRLKMPIQVPNASERRFAFIRNYFFFNSSFGDAVG